MIFGAAQSVLEVGLTPPKKTVIMLVWDWKGAYMIRNIFTPEQIMNKLRKAKILISQGDSITYTKA